MIREFFPPRSDFVQQPDSHLKYPTRSDFRLNENPLKSPLFTLFYAEIVTNFG